MLVLFVITGYRGRKLLSILTSFYSILYGILISLFSYFSIEYFAGWIFIPLLFYATSDKGFYYLIQCERIIFTAIFFSAGFWKVRAGGVLNYEQMSAILLEQHKNILVSNPEHWYSTFIYYIINNKPLSFFLYLSAAIMELFFIIGFFTKKYDRVLMWMLIVFIVLDFCVMQIFYFGWIIFATLYYYSKFKLKEI
jgi:hypothetical protein